jgi:type II secretory ATPase GspE/PulE/Tfp pilus assembly ATPase PilB-like protein
MAATNMNLTGIARKLVMDNHLDEATAVEAVEAVEKANKESIQLASYLVKNNIVPSRIIAMISSQKFGLPVFDLTVLDTEMAAFALVQEKLIAKLNAILLFKRGNKLLLDAINKGASDVHFEAYEKRYRMRYRIDGILSEVASPPISKRSISPVPCRKTAGINRRRHAPRT